jgi:hypothetical protein
MSIFFEEEEEENEENVFALSLLFWRLSKLSSQYLSVAAYILSSITIYHMIVSIKLICVKQLPCNYNNVVIKFLNPMM